MSKRDFISEIKSNEKKNKKEIDEEKEAEYKGDSDNEAPKTTGVIKETSTSNSNQPKNLSDLLADDVQALPKKPKKKKNSNQTKKEEGEKQLKFFNSKKTNNNNNEPIKKTSQKYDTSKLNEHIKDNENVKEPKKNYLEKDIQKAYKDVDENIEKPQFTNLKVDKDKENFVELNKNEDVRIFFIINLILYIVITS